MKTPRLLKTFILISFALLLPGVSQIYAAESVVLQLPWHHQFQFSGYYMAKELGYYQQAGLDVEIRDVTQGNDSVEEVVSGQADIGISYSGLIVERSLGKPVVVIASIFQKTPIAFLALKQSGIREIGDLAGKRVMLYPGVKNLSLLALLHKEKLLDKIERIETNFNVNSLLNGQADVFHAYRSNEPHLLESQGYETTMIFPEDYGIYFYGDTLFTSESTLESKPELVEQFRRASIRGWEYALKHPDEVIDIILSEYQSKKTKEQLLFEAAEIKKVIQADRVPIGTTDFGRWAQIAHHLTTLGVISPDFHLGDQFLYKPPHGIEMHWDELRPWVAGGIVSFVLFVAFLSVLLRTNRRLKIMQRQLHAEVAERKQAEETIQKSEEKFKRIFKISPDSININRLIDGVYLETNEGFTLSMGYTADEIVGVSSLSLNIWKENKDRNKLIRELTDKGFVKNMEVDFVAKNGDIVTGLLSAQLLELDGENAILSVTRDMTEWKQLEEKRKLLEEQLREKHKMEAVGYMAGGMAHNFNNNLAIILGNIELSKMKTQTLPEVSEYLDNAKIAVTRSRDLISKIITYSRGGITEKAPMQLFNIVTETMGLLRSTLPSTVFIETEIAPECDITFIHADASQLQEALINLCNNAVQAMAEKGDLHVSLKPVKLKKEEIPVQYDATAGRYARLSVRDNGCGIPADIKGKIYDPFFTTKEDYEGAGMGLATVQGIVSQHGGMITVDSSDGQGATFNLYFPILEQETTAPESTPINDDLPGGTELILFVDDEPMLTSLGERLLSPHGYSVSTMTDSQEALKLFAANAEEIDLVITDQTMPNLSGKGLIQEIRRIRPNIPTILCTGFSTKIDENKAEELGIDAFLMKPLESTQLLQTVRRVLDKNSP